MSCWSLLFCKVITRHNHDYDDDDDDDDDDDRLEKGRLAAAFGG